MKKRIFISLPILIAMMAIISSCKKEDPPPPNPYDAVDYSNPTTQPNEPDPNSITGIHKNVLEVYCNNPGCHDGSFEPDFRTVHTAWTTLVYHPVVKNTADTAYSYRVIPYDTAGSMLMYRLHRNSPALQQMPASGAVVPQERLDNITNWILDGAKDMFGQVATLPNNEPLIVGYVVYNQNYTVRVDTIRYGTEIYDPILLDANTTYNFVMLVDDDSTAVQDMQVNQLRFSYLMNNFSSAQNFNATFIPGFDIWNVAVNTAAFMTDTVSYFRYYVNDGDHTSDTEFPRNESNDAYKSYFSIYVKP